MDIRDRDVLVLGGSGLVGRAVCRQLLTRRPTSIRIHGLVLDEVAGARDALERVRDVDERLRTIKEKQRERESRDFQLHRARETAADREPEAGLTEIAISAGDIFGLAERGDRRDELRMQLGRLADEDLHRFGLYRLLTETRPDIVVDCVNTATAIAYRNVFAAAERVERELDAPDAVAIEELLESLYVPRLIRHLQVLYRGMMDAGTTVYVKVGTSGTGGMGLNVPYTHSEEKPSRTLLAKSAVAGAHSMLLFLMARTPGAPITKEVKPAAAIAWKKIGRGPIRRRGQPIRLVRARPGAIGDTFSSDDPSAAETTDEILETAYIDSGENGVFSVEEFALLSSAGQMEYVTPEEIAQILVFEIEGGNTGHDVINALDNSVLGPTYRAGMMRHRALDRMIELERQGTTRSVAFEMLGPPRNSKLLFEAHLLREEFGTMAAVREASGEEVSERLDRLVRDNPRLADEVVSVGIPILLPSGELVRGQNVIVPERASAEPVTPEKLESWVDSGWVDLRPTNCARWVERCRAIHGEIEAIPGDESSSRYLRDRRFWDDEGTIQPGPLVGWILAVEDLGSRFLAVEDQRGRDERDPSAPKTPQESRFSH